MSIPAHGPWALLGIAPTRQARDIKRAYAARLKTVRPDDDPAGFQALRQAYEWALARCEGQAPQPPVVHLQIAQPLPVHTLVIQPWPAPHTPDTPDDVYTQPEPPAPEPGPTPQAQPPQPEPGTPDVPDAHPLPQPEPGTPDVPDAHPLP